MTGQIENVSVFQDGKNLGLLGSVNVDAIIIPDKNVTNWSDVIKNGVSATVSFYELPIMVTLRVSQKGKNWDGSKLDDDNLKADTLVVWRNRFYTTGNRRHEKVELYIKDNLIRIASMKHIYLVDVKHL